MQFNITSEKILVFWLVFARLSGLMMSVPILSSSSVPIQIKLAASLFFSLIIFPLINYNTQVLSLSTHWILYTLTIGKEIIIGLSLGYIINFLFVGIQLAGQIIDFQMGFGMARVIDPQSRVQTSLTSQFSNILAIMIFLGINAHYALLKAMVESFNLIPLYVSSLHPQFFHSIVTLAGNIFAISLKAGAPIIIVLLLVQISIGIMNRIIPQMNIFMVSLPLKIGIGLLMISLVMPYFLHFLVELFGNSYQNLLFILKIAGG